jgi:hypothetical protein
MAAADGGGCGLGGLLFLLLLLLLREDDDDDDDTVDCGVGEGERTAAAVRTLGRLLWGWFEGWKRGGAR